VAEVREKAERRSALPEECLQEASFFNKENILFFTNTHAYASPIADAAA